MWREDRESGGERARVRAAPGGPLSHHLHPSILTLSCLFSFFHTQFLDGATLLGARALNKVVRGVLATEKHVYTVDAPRFIHGEGLGK